MTTFADTDCDDTTITNPGFEDPIGSTWTVSRSKLYIDATWERLSTLLARTGDYVMRCKLMKSGANYRGSTWIYNQVYPTTAKNHAYRVTVYAKRWLASLGANWALRVQVSSDGALNEYTDYSCGTFTTAWKACTHDFTGDGEDYFTITCYCIADDANTQEYPVIIDDVTLTNLSKDGSWAESVTDTDPGMTEDAAVDPGWTEVTT